MKKAIVLLLILLYFQCRAQNATELEAKQILGEKFISSKEIGLEKVIPVPFTKEEIILNHDSWLIPIENDAGIINYEFIQINYGSEYLGTILSLKETMKVINVTSKAQRNFPNKELFKFFKTGTTDKTSAMFDIDLKKTIVCAGNEKLNFISLPSETEAVAMGEKSVYYILNDGNIIDICSQKEKELWVHKYKVISLTK